MILTKQFIKIVHQIFLVPSAPSGKNCYEYRKSLTQLQNVLAVKCDFLF